MRKTKLAIWFSFVAILVLVIAVPVSAAMLIPASERGREKSQAENAPMIEEVDSNLLLSAPGLERLVYIHYKKGYAKPPWAGGGKKAPKCYGFLGKGVQWKDLPIDFVVNPTNSDGLSTDFVTEAIAGAAEEWDSWTSKDLFSGYTINPEAIWDTTRPNGQNELLFGSYEQDQVIAVAVVWGYFSGPPQNRQIIEFDILFNDYYAWGDATDDQGVMDLQNIATHEIGHGLGLDDLYESVCLEETMYGYSTWGETKKRDLHTGDIIGIQELYGKI